jgi:hypothetical protein
MKTFIILFAIVLIGLIVCNPTESSTKTNSLILLDHQSGIDFTDSAIELVNKCAGEVYHVFRSKVLMGYVPPDNVAHLIGKAGILNIYQNQTQPDKTDPITNSAIQAFNNLLQPVKELTEEEMQKRTLEGIRDKVRITYPSKSSKTDLPDRFTSEYMIGRVAVGIVIVEGNGDPQYDWTPQGLDSVTAQIIQGLDWLANKASESNSNVCWFYDWHYSVPVNGEPINGPSGVDCTDEDCVVWWIAQAMSAIGYGSGDLSAVYNYVHDIRYMNRTDWAFAMFVANGNTFTDGEYAWAMGWNDRHFLGIPIGRDHGGPYLVMTRDNKVFGLDDMWHVVAHESFHMFGPVDEYERAGGSCENSGSCDDKFGYLQIENRNCEYCDGSTYCVMRDVWAWQGVCVYTRYQAGWRDLDGDGPADPIDPNSHRYCWIDPPLVGGPVQIGDIIKTWTLDGDFVKSIAITPDNCGLRLDGYCAVMWDGTNAWGATCAPGIYLLTLNDGSPHTIPLLTADPSVSPVFSNIQFENGVLYWRLSDGWAYVRLKIYDSSDQLVLYPIKDKFYFPNSYYQNEHHETILFGLIEGETYTAEFFGWSPAGRASNITEYSFVYHGPRVLSPNGGEEWESMSTHDIIWDFPGVSGNVKIEYSTDGGTSWKLIIYNTPNDGFYPWTLPYTYEILSACRVKVSAGLDGVPWDMSDEDFSITPPYSIAPSNLTGSQSGPDRVTLNWQDNTSIEWGFTIYCDGCLCGFVGPNVTTYVDSGLVPGRSYVYWVKAYWEASESPPSNADTVTLSSFGSFSSPGEFPIKNDISTFSGIPSKEDTLCDLWIGYTTGYPGHFAEIEMWMANLAQVCGFNFLIKLRDLDSTYSDSANFHTVNISQDSILIGSDWVDYPVRECFIDTTGSLISNFNSLFSRGQPADTTLPDSKYLWVKGWAPPDNCIPVSPSYRVLFKLGVDLSCICDSDTMRWVLFDIPFGYLVDHRGNSVPFRYYPQGKLFAWVSVPGDANNDSTVNMADITFLVNYLFGGGDPPCIWEAADPDSSCDVNIGDIIYLVNYLFGQGPRLKRGCFCPELPVGRRRDIDIP